MELPAGHLRHLRAHQLHDLPGQHLVSSAAVPQLAVAAAAEGEDAAVGRQARGVVLPAGRAPHVLVAEAAHLRGEVAVLLAAYPQLAVSVASPGVDGAGEGHRHGVVAAAGDGGDGEAGQGLQRLHKCKNVSFQLFAAFATNLWRQRPVADRVSQSELSVRVVSEGEESARVGEGKAVAEAGSHLDDVERAQAANHPGGRLKLEKKIRWTKKVVL